MNGPKNPSGSTRPLAQRLLNALEQNYAAWGALILQKLYKLGADAGVTRKYYQYLLLMFLTPSTWPPLTKERRRVMYAIKAIVEWNLIPDYMEGIEIPEDFERLDMGIRSIAAWGDTKFRTLFLGKLNHVAMTVFKPLSRPPVTTWMIFRDHAIETIQKNPVFFGGLNDVHFLTARVFAPTPTT